MTRRALLVFTRDLRVSDHPALAAAAAADEVVPAFVFDERILAGRQNRPNRAAFLRDCLRDLDASLRRLGARLVVRRGDWSAEVLRLAQEAGAGEIHVTADASGYASSRLRALGRLAERSRIAVHAHPGHGVVEPGTLLPAGGRDHFSRFTPFYERWSTPSFRAPVGTPRALRLPADFGDDRSFERAELPGRGATGLPPDGESAATARSRAFLQSGVARYAGLRDDLAADATSHLSADLHFGCLSAAELARAALAAEGGEPYARQLCWRDFHLQVLAARPDAAWSDYRPPPAPFVEDANALAAWQQGCTGYPLVDAAMRQLAAEGFMPNRTRMVVASLLTRHLNLDWRLGAAHFLEHLVDGDVANNSLNWQWVAGTGLNPNPWRVLNPTVQARRFDPDGVYVRRFVPELAGLPRTAVLDPSAEVRASTGYPQPIVRVR